MIPHVGIDLGTTFSSMSYIGKDGVPVIIKNKEGKESTPSVVWFDGRVAYVGEQANQRKISGSAIYECVKRDIGKDTAHRYTVNGINYGACGFSAIILKKLYLEGFTFYKKQGWLPDGARPGEIAIPAVITVPAYFGDSQRNETRKAGIAAGFDVMAIVNEPMAAALTYGVSLREPKKVLVFDLGGGTFDVAILEVKENEASVLVSDGADELGGKDWDEIIVNYLIWQIEQVTGKELPNDLNLTWDIKNAAHQAKIDLSTEDMVNLNFFIDGENITINLYRSRPQSLKLKEKDDNFYLEERSTDLLTQCAAILNNTIESSNLTWNDIDEIVLAGGSSRMPMFPKMLEKLSGHTIRKNIINYDTAISQGAALYGRNRAKVTDVTAKSIGIEVEKEGRQIVRHLIKKNSPLPIHITQNFHADANAVLRVYEGESASPDECVLRGRLELGNPEGSVDVSLSIDVNGMLVAAVECDGVKAELKIKSDTCDIGVEELTEFIKKVDVRL